MGRARIPIRCVGVVALVACGPTVESGHEGSTAGTARADSTGMGRSSTSDATVPVSDEGTAETTPPIVKGEVDESALVDGVTVNLQPALGEVIVPFVTPLPDVPRDALQAAMLDAVAVVVTSPRTLASVDLSVAMVAAELVEPGAVDWTVATDRTAVQFIFVNETPGGLVLTPGEDYVVHLQISSNEYVERLAGLQFTATTQ